MLCPVCEVFVLGASASREQINLAAREVGAELARRYALTLRHEHSAPRRLLRPTRTICSPAPPDLAPGQAWAYLASEGPASYVPATPANPEAPPVVAVKEGSEASAEALLCSWCGRPGQIVSMTSRAQGQVSFRFPVLCEICAACSKRFRWPERRAAAAGLLLEELDRPGPVASAPDAG